VRETHPLKENRRLYNVYTFYFTSPLGALYNIVMSMNVSLSVCSFARSHISKTVQPNMTIFVHVASGRGSLCTSDFVDDVMFSHNQPYGAPCVCAYNSTAAFPPRPKV